MQVWEILDGSYTGGGRSGISAMFAHLVDGNHHVRWYATRGRVKHVELARGTILVDQGPALRVRSDPDVTHFSLRLCLGWRRPDRLRSFQQASRRAATPIEVDFLGLDPGGVSAVRMRVSRASPRRAAVRPPLCVNVSARDTV